MTSPILRRCAVVVALTPSATALTLADTAHAQSLDIRGAGCIGPCHKIMCCGKAIVVNKDGVGLGRDIDCQQYLDSAPREERRALCTVFREQGATCLQSCRQQEDPDCPLDVNCSVLEEQRAELLAQEALLEVLGESLRECEDRTTRLWQKCVEQLGGPCAKASCPVRQEYSDAAKRLEELYLDWVSSPRGLYEKCCDPSNPCIPPLRVENPADRSETQQRIADCVENAFSKCMKQAAAACAAATATCIGEGAESKRSTLRCVLVGEVCAAAAGYRCALKAKDCNANCREEYDDVDGCVSTAGPAASLGVTGVTDPSGAPA